jgi:hypothetical protein
MVAVKTNSLHELRREMVEWVRETEALLMACQLLVEYFGTDEEIESFVKASRGGRSTLKGMVKLITSRFEHRVQPQEQSVKFECSAELAKIVSPILHLLATPVPDFVVKARHELSGSHAKNVVNALGLFVGIMAENIYTPVWAAHPDLAPDGYPL